MILIELLKHNIHFAVYARLVHNIHRDALTYAFKPYLSNQDAQHASHTQARQLLCCAAPAEHRHQTLVNCITKRARCGPTSLAHSRCRSACGSCCAAHAEHRHQKAPSMPAAVSPTFLYNQLSPGAGQAAALLHKQNRAAKPHQACPLLPAGLAVPHIPQLSPGAGQAAAAAGSRVRCRWPSC
jgi:hypothetical protein